ncbi:hypothetical protein DOTSEDRAFT_87732 [Dothistroma septosporum NZE10]|uniref:Apple domain-containing protein n=1 Tax=Dothistroma septosporum (strain NZE10 / CBS 128990) TaxID=675120 RepID=N1PPL1_DOTSN|nr:hypothetical protein DOTSEDRAFT_87732 [Dothistroma septosporum NZE10]
MLKTLSISLLVASTYAVPTVARDKDESTSVDSTGTCFTKYRHVTSTPAELPTRTRTVSQTVSSTITACGDESTITTTITPPAVTSTAPGYGLKPRQALCSTTTTVTAGVTTAYTGAYNGTLAKRTASPLDLRLSPARYKSFKPDMLRIFGQQARMANVKQQAVKVACLAQITTYVFTTTTVLEAPATETVTAETPTLYVTSARKVVADSTASFPSLVSGTIPVAANSTGVCTQTVAASTTTQHLKCAPTNLISEVNGYGIGQTGGNSANTRGLAPGSDASACCQLCVDTEGCAASEDDPDAANCFLWYTEPTCGLGFQYSDGGQRLEPGSGFTVQTGCGTIEAVKQF